MTRKAPKKTNPYKPKRNFKEYLKFILVAIGLLVILDYYVWDGERPYAKKIRQEYEKELALEKQQQVQEEQEFQETMDPLLPPEVVYPEDGSEYFEAPSEIDRQSMLKEKQLNLPPPPETEFPPLISPPLKRVPMVAGQRPKIAIVIDDVGMNLKESQRAIDLPAPVTLAFLPYAEKVRSLADQAKLRGHEMIIHTPMEAMDITANLGPLALLSNMDFAAFDAEFEKMADSFDGYVGINNHMGSRLTQNPEAMGFLMDELKKRGLYFLDSKTISTSIAAQTAEIYGIPYAVRDVFLDHVETPEFTAKALQNVERIAAQTGSAIAIGHPKAITVDALQKWLPTLQAKGFDLVAVSSLLARPDQLTQNIQEIESAAGIIEEETTGEPTPLIIAPAPDQWRSLPLE